MPDPTETADPADLRSALESLRRSEERMRLMVDAVRDYAIYLLDPDGKIVSWNSGAERIKGYKASEVIGRHFSLFYTDEARAAEHPAEELTRALAEGRYEEQGWRVRKNGERFWANVVLTAVYDARGNHVGFTKVTRDFTEQRAAEEQLRLSEERMRLMIESVRDYAIFMLDPDGRVASWNTGAQRIKGYSASEIIGKSFSTFYTPEDRARRHPEHELQLAIANGAYSEEGWRVRKNGEKFWASVVINAMFDSHRVLRGFAKVTRDLTERRRMEEEARRAEHEKVAAQLTAIEAQTALRIRDEFMSVAAHELRTPLAALQLKLEGAVMMMQKIEAQKRETALLKAEERVTGAVRNVERLAELVERLLEVSRISGGQLHMNVETMDLAMLVRQVAGDFRETSQQAGCELRVRTPETLVGTWDKSRLEQVVINLVSNAIKYGGGKPIELALAATGSGARITVTDHGIGIAPEDAQRIFARFERAASVRHYAGLGIGLYVARSIVEKHGGQITVTSVPGQGSTFTVDLPIHAIVHDDVTPATSEGARQ